MLRMTVLHAGLILGSAIAASSGHVHAADDALVVYSAGIEAILADPRDERMLNLMRLIDDRIAELPAELDEGQIPGPMLQMLANGFMGPMSLRAGMIPGGGPADGPPIYAQLDLHRDPHLNIDQFAGMIGGMMSMMGPEPGQPLEQLPSISTVDMGQAQVFHGVNPYADNDAFTIAVNRMSEDAATPPALVMPGGTTPVFAVDLDLPKIQPLIDMMLAEAGDEERDAAESQLAMYGLYGPNAMHVQYAMSHAEDRSHHVYRLGNSMRQLKAQGLAPTSLISRDVLHRIPSDATAAQVSSINIKGYKTAMRRMLEGIPASPMVDENQSPYDMVRDMFRQYTGLDPFDDLLDHLGQFFGIYMSDTTGGGGLLSAVYFVEVENEEAFQASLNQLCGRANALFEGEAQGYVRFQNATMGQHTVTVLTFPGLPVPFELCMAISNGYLYAAPTPSGLEAAIDQANGRGPSLMDNPRFRAMGGASIDNAMRVSFVDTPRTARSGYALMSLAMSGLNNGVRSPNAPQRGGLLANSMPKYNELMADAKATVEIIRVDGDDLVGHTQADRSMTVNLCGTIGMLGSGVAPIMAAAVGAGLVLPAFERARENAQQVEAMAQMRQMIMAAHMHGADAGRLPEAIDQLAPYLDDAAMNSPFGPMWDGEGDYWLDLRGLRMDDITDPSRQIWTYDRAMFSEGDVVAVGFYDGHVELLDIDEFFERIEQPRHEGLDFKRPW